MLKIDFLRNVLKSAALIACSAGLASADSINFTYSIPDGVYSTVPINVQTFNPTLGTLTGVEFLFDGDFQLTLNVINFNGSQAANYTVYGTGETTITGPDGLDLDLTASSAVQSDASLAPLSEDTFGPLAASGSMSTSPGDLSDYIGGPGIFTTVDFNVVQYSASGSSTSGTPFYSASGESGASLEVIYTFNDPVSSTPEPASLILMGSALLVAGLLRKRLKV